MRILTIIAKSDIYIKNIYQRHPDFSSRSYEDQSFALVNETYGGSEIWSTGLLKFGYQSIRLFANVPQIQYQWAKEHGISFTDENWRETITIAQIKMVQPDIVFINSYATFSAEFVRSLRVSVPSIRLIVVWCGTFYRDLSTFREYDFILSNIPEMVDEFTSKGLCCYHLDHALDPRILDNIDTHGKASENFSFVGSIVKSNGYHKERESLLIELIKSTDLQIWSKVSYPTVGRRIRIHSAQLLYDSVQIGLRAGLPKNWLTKLPLLARIAQMKTRPNFDGFIDSAIVKLAHPPLFGTAMFQKLRDSKVTLNTHTNISPKSASNMRLFEATGVGACLLTDWKQNLGRLFEPEIEAITYKDAKECIAKVHYLLQNEKERQAIAEAGQRRTLQFHTIYHRAEQLDEIIRGHLRNKSKVNAYNE